ncbi:MAG TPA: cbb3-type cytochrome oxidase assembly protein CcoS, partial [Thermodesulfobacteriota bacterium]|nr:cbb3-type cytochrome oxidase assembly protein CcoS [Thermodesulfobacteriota bacterium]
MNIIFLTLGVSIAIALIFLGAFIWAAGRGQYDDLETPGHRMLLDDYESDKKNQDAKEETGK